jgi:hypothetical protein
MVSDALLAFAQSYAEKTDRTGGTGKHQVTGAAPRGDNSEATQQVGGSGTGGTCGTAETRGGGHGVAKKGDCTALPDATCDAPHIRAEPLLPTPHTPERKLADAAHARLVRGISDVAMRRPPSWAGAEALPSPGCWCSCCRGRRWWRRRVAAGGWCCCVCHPPPDSVPVIELST